MKFLDAATGGGVNTKKVLTTRERLLRIADAFDRRPTERFTTFLHVEKPEELDGQPFVGSVLEVVARALNGLDITTEEKPTAVMAALPFTVKQLNYFACYCHNGETMTGDRAARVLRNLADPNFKIPELHASPAVARDTERFRYLSNRD